MCRGLSSDDPRTVMVLSARILRTFERSCAGLAGAATSGTPRPSFHRRARDYEKFALGFTNHFIAVVGTENPLF